MTKTVNEIFIEKARKIHGDKYDYSKVEYVNNKTKVCVICPEHGEFWQIPNSHLKGKGCQKCAIKKRTLKKKKDTDFFLEKAYNIHGNKYDYSKVEYKGNDVKVCIICPEHGEFWQTPAHHLQGEGCPKCVGRNKTTEEFIKECIKIHGDKYDYSKVEYVNNKTKVCIVCPEHGEFWQTPTGHLSGKQCPKCSKVAMDKEYLIEKARKIHGDKYDYSKVEYVNAQTKICIICPKHGEFWQLPYVHMKGCCCPKCSNIKRAIKNRLTKEEFVKRSNLIHKNRYDYSKINYIDMHTKVCIIDPEYGEFWQSPDSHLQGNGCLKSVGKGYTKEEIFESILKMHGNKYSYPDFDFKYKDDKIPIICPTHGLFYKSIFLHLKGQGCPICSNNVSLKEDEIFNFIKNLGFNDILQRVKNIITPKELDIYIPSKNIAIEYNGLRWHSEEFGKDRHYHLSKTDECKKQGIKLIQIFEDEYLNHKEIVMNKILHILSLQTDLPKIMGRKCIIKEINYKTSTEFLEKYHIQGKVTSTLYLGAYYEDQLIAVMSFKKERNEKNKWELTRFASNYHYICQGIGGKLFKYFIRKYNPIEIKSFADRRWTVDEDNNLYIQLGFKFDKYTLPDYRYYNPNDKLVRIHKFNMRKNNLIKKYGADANDTESEMTEKLGFFKIWDCGLIKYKWIKE